MLEWTSLGGQSPPVFKVPSVKITQSVKWFIQGDSSNAKRARRIAKITLVVVLFAGLFWIVPFADVVQALLNVNPILLVLGLIIGFLVAFLDSWSVNVWLLE